VADRSQAGNVLLPLMGIADRHENRRARMKSRKFFGTNNWDAIDDCGSREFWIHDKTQAIRRDAALRSKPCNLPAMSTCAENPIRSDRVARASHRCLISRRSVP
jgi:hypothetical protein